MIKGEYGQSENGNFKVINTIGVPHPYCISAKLVGFASDRFGGMLGEAAIRAAEKEGIYCDICKGQLSYDAHEQALLVGCLSELKDNDKTNPELHKYLLDIKDECERNGYVGFAFKKGF